MSSPARDARNRILANLPNAVVVERGRGHIKMYDPVADRFAAMYQAGGRGWHYGQDYDQEVDTAWINADLGDAPFVRKMVAAEYNAYFGNGNLRLDSGMPFRYVNPNTGDYIQWQPQGQTLQWTNDLNQLENVGLSTQAVEAQISDDLLTFPGAWGSGLDFYLQLQSARLQKRISINSAATIGTPPQFILDGGNPVLMASFIFLRSSGVTAWLDGVQWAEGNGQSNARASVDSVEFRASDGTTLWYLSPAIAWDSSENDRQQVTGPIRFRRSGGTYFIELRIPWAWLQTAVYPVTIDPTVDQDVAGSLDDSFENASSANATIGSGNADGVDKMFGFRWQGVTIPDGATINTAYLSVYVYNGNLDEPDVTIDFEDSSTPAAFATASNDVSSRTGTSETVNWASANLGGAGWYDTSSVVVIIEELMASYSYASGAAMVARLTGSADAARDCGLYLYDQDPAYAAGLYIDYTAAGGADPEGSLLSGKLIRGGLLRHGVLVGG